MRDCLRKLVLPVVDDDKVEETSRDPHSVCSKSSDRNLLFLLSLGVCSVANAVSVKLSCPVLASAISKLGTSSVSKLVSLR
jgi:hypothetical protein